MRLDAFSIYHKYGIIVATDNISVSVRNGEFVGILGPNGSGKTTLLRILSGAITPTNGTVLLDGENICKIRPGTLAKKIAVVPQNGYIPFPFSVLEVVMMGRAPYITRFSRESEKDVEIAYRAMEDIGITHLINRKVPDLSYGERQRVIIARALAQKPKILLLDEPISHLDPGYRTEIMNLFKALSRDIGVLAVLHDINLASQYADRLIILKKGKKVSEGTPKEVITKKMLRDVYRVDAIIQNHPLVNCPQMISVPNFTRSPKKNGLL